jgi:hypothetical protein
MSGLIIKGVRETASFSLPPLYENNFIPDTKHEVATPESVRKHPSIQQFKDKFCPFDKEAMVTLLIGRDAGELMATRTTKVKAPFIHKTPLGFAVVGSMCPRQLGLEGNFTTLRTALNLEHFGAQIDFQPADIFAKNPDDEIEGMSQNDKKFCDLMQQNYHVNKEGNLEMPLPLKCEDSPLPDNRRSVFCRQYTTLKRLRADSTKLKKCINFMQDMMDNNHVEKVPPEEEPGSPGKTWYLPIFPVEQTNKGKVRLVFDSAASYAGISLNSYLIQGPDQTNKLRGVLARFREGKVGFVADVKSMFHSFHVNKEHRDYMRFYWFNGNDPKEHLHTYRARVHIFGNTCSPAVATIGLRLAADSLTSNGHPNSAELNAHKYIHQNFYVDDGLGCAATTDEAINTLRASREALAKFNIKLHKIVSSNKVVVEAFPPSERGKETCVELTEGDMHRTLGVAWNIIEDCFTMRVDLPNRPFTKRGLLSVINSIYDPIGLACPVVLGDACCKGKYFLGSTMTTILSPPSDGMTLYLRTTNINGTFGDAL